MKGFKKDGKFRPTENRTKSSLRKEDVKSFEDSHAENIARQVESRKMLLVQHKETLDMHECTRCPQQFDKNDPLFDIRVSRHIAGRHQHHYVKGERPYQGELISKSMMGGMDIGEAKFVPEKEKRNKESLSYNDSREDVFSRIKDKGFVIKEEREEIPISEREELGEDVYISNRIQISEEQLLGVMNGKRSAGEMIDIITDTNEDERLRFDIDTSNHLLKLEEEGKAKVVDGKWVKV